LGIKRSYQLCYISQSTSSVTNYHRFGRKLLG